METNDDRMAVAEESLDSVPQPRYEAIDEEDDEIYNDNGGDNDINELMTTEDNFTDYVEQEEEEEEDNEEDEHDVVNDGQYKTSNILLKQDQDSKLSTPQNRHHNNSNNNDTREGEMNEDENFSLEYNEEEEEEEDEIVEDYVPDTSQIYVEHITADNKSDPLIVQGNDGMIKKIKINNSTKNINSKSIGKIKNFLNTTPTESQNKYQQARSSTPMSREYIALQKSVNDSKILTEFVTDAASEKPRKLRTKDTGHSLTSSSTDHSYSSLKKSNQLSSEKLNSDDTNNSISSSQGKRLHKRYAPLKVNETDVDSSANLSYRSRSKSPSQVKRSYKRFAPLKDGDTDVDSSTNLRPRSRSKSIHNSEMIASTGSHKKLKKWPSEERIHKRTNMRSENSEFAQKQFEFLQRVIHAGENPRSRSRSRSHSHGRSKSCGRKTPNLGESAVSEQPDDISSVNESQTSLLGLSTLMDNTLADVDEVEEQLKTDWQPPPKPGYDSFCWKCHESRVNLCCCKCIRSFHASCMKINKFDNTWLCPECTLIENILNNPKRSRRNDLSLDLLSQLLSFALKRMRYTKGHYNFIMPYEESTMYKKYIVNPVTLTDLQTKIETKEFRCAEEFVNETKWMMHNAYILSNRTNNKITLASKSIFKICRQEVNEIDTCAECYLNANTRTDWFVDVCSQPHLLLWAKLKGFPYWPAKAMGLGPSSLVNVRFFGEHDRAFVPLKDCYLFSEQDPNTTTGKRAARELADCIKEVEEHIEKIRNKVGSFKYAPFKIPYDPAEEMRQLSEMMPGVEEFIKKQQGMNIKPSLQFKIYKTADNNLSIVQKASTTPELPTSNHEMDGEKEKERKKKTSSESSETKKLEESVVNTSAKYEVVSKVNSDDSNSSKLSTVILKRKSVNGESKKVNDDDTVELPLPKMTKIEDPPTPTEEEKNKLTAKRKLETTNVEKSKAKHTKVEPKIPIITIKTTVANSVTNDVNSKVCMESTNNTKDKDKELVSETQAETNVCYSVSQQVMQNLVKHKQGVTIKKISKDVTTVPKSSEQNSINKSKETAKESNKDKKSEEEKAKENQKVNNILKGLVPFVEVKQEVLSDNEQELEKQTKEKEHLATSNQDKQTQIANNTNKDNVENPSETLVNNSQPTKEAIVHESTSLETAKDKEDSIVLLTKVKEEVVTDEEDNNNTNTTTANNTNTITTKLTNSNNDSNMEKSIPTTNASDIRVLGGTTIQKVITKNSQVQYYAYTTPNSTANSSNTNSSQTKRSTLKGIPYGPLPASAFPKSIATKTFQQTTDLNLQPRAKKSFPQHSPPLEKLRPINNTIITTQISPQLDQKRTMAKNTMVAIPVDVATNRNSNVGNTLVIGSIPVPPLTAVSKTIPSSVALNSTARNVPATITVSGNSGSLTTPSITAQVKITTPNSTIVRSSPITVSSTASLAPLTTSTSSISSTPVTSILNPLTMTTPPPLAGLSSNSTATTPQTNGINEVNNIRTLTSSPASSQQQQHTSTDTHLLGGLVTPTLASAITDVICRGPPKLSARPTGPLQSEGHPMFPSQAGPVCKRLVENAHKLTDFFISVVEDTMGEMALGDDASLQAKITLLAMELERTKQAYEQEIAELKRTSDLMLCEMRKSMENEKTRLVNEIRKNCEMERLRSVEETKRKQWCANCFREANFYCCWNTSYCDYPCQQLHWARHSHTCAQTRTGLNETTTTAASTITTSTERHLSSKSSTLTLNSAATNFNKSTSISQKKEKGVSKNSTNQSMMSSLATATPASASRTNTEVLKLPTNTYLRPVTSNINNQSLRCNAGYSIPVQRFNAPMPITSPANNNQQTYTIVQQGNSWVMSSTSNANNNTNSSATNSSTIAAPIANVPQITGQGRSTGAGVGSIITNKSGKTQIRYH